MKTEFKVKLENVPNSVFQDGYLLTNDFTLGEVEHNQATEILIDCLELVECSKLTDAVRHWFTKLRKGGQLIISGIDLVQVSKACLTKQLNIPQVNAILYGRANRCCLTLDDIVHIMEEIGLKIITKRLVEMKYVVIGERQ